jgi:hypothetical protein
MRAARCALLALAALALQAQTHTYIGQITASSVLIAWGSTAGSGGVNSIGRDSASLGHARVKVGDQNLETDRNWIEVKDLHPDTSYPYQVLVNNQKVGEGSVRTYPDRATTLAFFVIGDFGTGDANQRGIANAMWQEFQKHAQSGNPIRFVITMGDNIYADTNLGYIVVGSGDQDRDWERKFFQPYAELLKQIPFYPSLGNHDGNSSENRGDLSAYLDNFFFPENHPARWYKFSFGGLADFFALDSTTNTTGGHPEPIFKAGGDESNWLARGLAESKALWKIPYFHHPPFNAGPGHGASLNVLKHWTEMFQQNGVRVVFNGHEHNFQFSEDNDATGHIRYVLSGAGGELRNSNVMGNMGKAHIEGWAPQRHFCVVEIEGRTMRVIPMGAEQIVVKDHSGQQIGMPLVIQLPGQ